MGSWVHLFGVGGRTVNKISNLTQRMSPALHQMLSYQKQVPMTFVMNHQKRLVFRLTNNQSSCFCQGSWSLSRCSDALLHLEYKLNLCEPNMEFKKLREEKSQQLTIVQSDFSASFHSTLSPLQQPGIYSFCHLFKDDSKNVWNFVFIPCLLLCFCFTN